MSDLKLWLHAKRPKHRRHMNRATAYVELGYWYKRMAAEKENTVWLVKGWKEIRRAIRELVDCGCPRDLWPGIVQGAIKEPQ